MSSYYYILCEDCKEYCDCCTSNTSQLGDAGITLGPFCYYHRNCNISVEYEDSEKLRYCLKWQENNYEKLLERNDYIK